MFVLYAYECPILSAYTLQQSRDIPTDNLKVNDKVRDGLSKVERYLICQKHFVMYRTTKAHKKCKCFDIQK